MKLLIVDDDRQIRSGLAESINWLSQGIDVVLTAADGLEALQLFDQEKPEIVLTDIRMPGLDGLELGREILKRSVPATVIILSGFSDFEYARQAMRFGIKDYLLKPVQIDDLLEVVRKARDSSIQRSLAQEEQQQLTREYLDKILGELLFSAGNEKDRLLAQLLDHWQIQAKTPVKVVRIEVDQAWKFPVQSTLAKLLLQIETILAALTGAPLVAACRHDDQIVAVIQPPPIETAPVALDPTSKLITTLCEQLHLPTTFTVALSRSGPVDSILELYQQANTAIQEKLYRGYAHVSTADQPHSFNTAYQVDPIMLRLLEQAVWDLDPIQASQVIRDLFIGIRNAHQANRACVEQICRDLKTCLIDGVRAQGFDFDGLFGSNLLLFEQRVGLETLFEYESWVAGLYEIVLTGLSEIKGARTSVSIRKAAEYMLQHFSENITLEEVAERVQKSPNYFSHLFKKILGISFCEYLNRIRVQEAKKLLKTTNLLAYEIAEKVGFLDYKYFNQVFRKLEGCSPSLYRKGESAIHYEE